MRCSLVSSPCSSSELGIWMRIANALDSFLKSKGQDPKTISENEAKLLIGWLLQGDDAAPAPLEGIAKTEDPAAKKRLEELNCLEVVRELLVFGANATPVVPAEFIDSVKDEK